MSAVIANGHHICVGHEGIAVGVGGRVRGGGFLPSFSILRIMLKGGDAEKPRNSPTAYIIRLRVRCEVKEYGISTTC